MASFLAALLLAQGPIVTTPGTPSGTVKVTNPGTSDGGLLLNVYVAGQAAGASGLTNTELRASAVPVVFDGGLVSVANFPATQTVTGPLTDAQLRATAVPVSLTSTAITGTVAVSGPLTDTQLRATAVPVSLSSTTVTGTVAVSGPLTDAQLRATAVPVSGTVTANAAQSGTWTVQPGNTANTTAWLVNGGQVSTANVDGACVSVTATTTVLANNASRRSASLVARMSNTDTVFLKLGATATTADFPLEPGQAFSLDGLRPYTGVVDAIANSGTQSVCVVELN